MYITGTSTEHCTIFSVISGLRDFTTDCLLYTAAPPIRHAPEPNVKKLSFPYIQVLLLLPYAPAAMATASSSTEVVAVKPLM